MIMRIDKSLKSSANGVMELAICQLMVTKLYIMYLISLLQLCLLEHEVVKQAQGDSDGGHSLLLFGHLCQLLSDLQSLWM